MDKVGWSQKVTEMGWDTDKGGKRRERKEGRLYHDNLVYFMFRWPQLMLFGEHTLEEMDCA